MTILEPGPDGLLRCPWGESTDDYRVYHDTEWGKPVHGDDALFERICLEAFQSGLSWITILRRREGFRAAFAGFRIAEVAAFTEQDEARLLADPGIIRNRLKIAAAVANARAAQALDGAWTRWCGGSRAIRTGPRRGARPRSRRSPRSPRRWPRSSSGRASGSSARPPPTR